jgi:peptide/nickel transport system substrate-binding protein
VKIWGQIGDEIMPEHIFADKDPATFTFFDPENGWPFGTGPYQLVSADEWEAVYDRRDTWWGVETGFKDRMPYPERIVWRAGVNEETRVAAAVANEYDWLHDITLGAYLALIDQNPNWEAWLPEMPYVWLDPCARQLSFNHTVAPWDDPDMRWAMNYATDRDEIVAIAYEGSTVTSRSMYPQYGAMEPFIQALENEVYPDMNPLEFNPEKAEEIFASKGYEKNDAGFWEKDGEELAVSIQVHEGFIEKRRIAQVVIEQWQRVGVNASIQVLAGATWEDNGDFGDYEIRADWTSCGSINEPWYSMDVYNTRWLTPIGERASSNIYRWSGEKADRFSELVDQIGQLPLGDPEIMPLYTEAMTLWTEELPVIFVTQARKLVPYNGTYWTGYPTSENNYNHPAIWWAHTHQVIHNLVPVDMVGE